MKMTNIMLWMLALCCIVYGFEMQVKTFALGSFPLTGDGMECLLRCVGETGCGAVTLQAGQCNTMTHGNWHPAMVAVAHDGVSIHKGNILLLRH